MPSLRRAWNTRGSERRAQRVRGERRGQTSAGRAARECPVRRVPVLAAEGRALDVRGAAARRVRGTCAGNAAQWRSLEDRECARGLESSVLVTWGSRNAPPPPRVWREPRKAQRARVLRGILSTEHPGRAWRVGDDRDMLAGRKDGSWRRHGTGGPAGGAVTAARCEAQRSCPPSHQAPSTSPWGAEWGRGLSLGGSLAPSSLLFPSRTSCFRPCDSRLDHGLPTKRTAVSSLRGRGFSLYRS